MDFRSKPGFTSSPLRMSMFGITTLTFALGIIALVLETTLDFQTIQFFDHITLYDDTFYGRYYAWETITCLMVRMSDALISLMSSDWLH